MDTNVLFLCGVFADENLQEVADNARGTIEYSANLFQQKMISGLKKTGVNLSVLSAPFIGAYPMRSSVVKFKGFKKNESNYKYVVFNNIWGYRNYSRAHSLKKSIRNFANECTNNRKIIIVYSAHEPFLEAAAYAKKIDPQIKICYVVPDLPQYMNLDANKSFIYEVLKKIDIAKMEKYSKYVDAFMVLTEQMKDVLKVGSRPSIVVEGIIEDHLQISEKKAAFVKDEKVVLYTGKMNEKFGVKELVDSFLKLKDQSYRLVLCGTGDCEAYVQSAVTRDNRIKFLGQLRPEEVIQLQKNADVLVNPRANNEEYTKYSFPSKNIEYLLTGIPVVAYMLEGMNEQYKEFIYVIDEDKRNLVETIEEAMNASVIEKSRKYNCFLEYAYNNLQAEHVARRIIEMCN